MKITYETVVDAIEHLNIMCAHGIKCTHCENIYEYTPDDLNGIPIDTEGVPSYCTHCGNPNDPEKNKSDKPYQLGLRK